MITKREKVYVLVPVEVELMKYRTDSDTWSVAAVTSPSFDDVKSYISNGNAYYSVEDARCALTFGMNTTLIGARFDWEKD